jgi:internalin A
MKVHVLAGALLLLLTIAALAAPVAASEIVTFNDPNLEDAVRGMLSKPEGDITADDMATLSELWAGDWGISDLSGLEYAVNLEKLALYQDQFSQNHISDISPLTGLTNLQELYLDYNQISDISPLAGLTNLQVLQITNNQISDISSLAGLTNLRTLFITTNQISDISPLAGLTNLEHLWLSVNQISDISPLAGLTNLQFLQLNNNQISDISPLVANSGIGLNDGVTLEYNYLDLTPGSADMIDIQTLQNRGVDVMYIPQNPVPASEIVTFNDPNLEAAVRYELNKPVGDITADDMTTLSELWAGDWGISDLSGLEYAANLQRLTLQHNQISDISPLASLTNLQELSLHENQISDISPLAGLTNLQELWLWSNQISDVSPLASLTNLQELYLEYNQISDITPLAGLTNLQQLSLEYNQISDLSGLEYAVNLQHLYLSYNQISDVSPLAGMTNLEELYLSSNQISDLSGLEYAVNLQRLDLYGNQISDISPLASLTNLWQRLILSHNQISDISPLAGLTNLQWLDLDNNQISDVSPLASLTNLQELYLEYNQISDISPLAGLTNLPNLDLSNNQISDVGPLGGLTNLEELYLSSNQISDISPLVANVGLGSDDLVTLYFNYLDLTPGSNDMNDIQTLQGRGVYVNYDPQNPVTTKPDLVVTDISWTPESPVEGDAMTFTATIQNIGDAATPADTEISLRFITDPDSSPGFQHGDASLNALLAPGESATVSASSSWEEGTWILSDGEHAVKAIVDYLDMIAESDEANNERSETITVGAAPVAPIADAGGLYSALVGLPITFDGSGSSDEDGSIVSYAWDFGDGESGTGVDPSHPYDSAGEYTVTLTVTDNDGLSDADTATVTVKTPEDGTADLVSEVEGLGLPADIEDGLTDKLDAAINALDKGNENAALKILVAFIKQVEAQRGKTLTADQVESLIAEAQQIGESIKAS